MIEKYTAQINPQAVGLALTVIVQISVEREHKVLLDELQKVFLACVQVQQCYYVTGDCDFVLVMLVQDMDEYVGLAEQLFQNNANIKSYKTLTVMKRVKAETTVAIL